MTAFVDKSINPGSLIHPDDLTEEQILQELSLIVVNRIVSMIDMIIASEDRNEIEEYIKIIEECEIALKVNNIPTRQAIREGIGDYKDIQEKCIKFGLV